MANRFVCIILCIAFFSCKHTNKISSREIPVEDYDFAMGVGAFAFDFHKVAHVTGENLFYSPLSIYSALGQTYAGAANQTASQMAHSMHFGSAFDVAKGYEAAIEGLVVQDTSTKLGLANAVWIQEGFSVLPGFTGVLDALYHSPAMYANFNSPGGREDARHGMNDWVKEITWGKIPELITSDVLNEYTRMVLVNALAFKGKWASGFDVANTRKDDFHLTAGGVSECDYMSKIGRFLVYRDEQHTFVAIPFTGGDFAVVLILPSLIETDEDMSLSRDTFFESISKMEFMNTNVRVPVLHLETKKSLAPYLQKMGMIDAFSTTADFSGITGTKELKIDQILHQAVLDMNEHGVEAAAATAVAMGVKSAFVGDPVAIHFNRPYSLFIIHKPSRLLLFAGKIEDPSRK